MTSLPVYRGTPIVGPVAELTQDILGLLTRLTAEYGDIVTTHAGPPGLRTHITAVMSPEVAERMLNASSYANIRKEGSVYDQSRGRHRYAWMPFRGRPPGVHRSAFRDGRSGRGVGPAGARVRLRAGPQNA